MQDAAVTIRAARPDDLAALTAIYNYYVRTGHITFDTDEFSVEERAEWFGHYASVGVHRLLVAERGGQVLGYASSSPFRPKPGYRTSVEASVYVAPDAIGAGLGRLLYAKLLPILDHEGVHRVYAGVALPNAASIGLHRQFGFTVIGTFTEVGWKLGRYIDVAWYERRPGGSDRLRG